MNNISGSPKSWLAAEETKKTDLAIDELPVEGKKLVLNGEAGELVEILEKLEEKYKSCSEKNLFDAMTSLESAIIALKKIN